jgi:hypothetical protein
VTPSRDGAMAEEGGAAGRRDSDLGEARDRGGAAEARRCGRGPRGQMREATAAAATGHILRDEGEDARAGPSDPGRATAAASRAAAVFLKAPAPGPGAHCAHLGKGSGVFF